MSTIGVNTNSATPLPGNRGTETPEGIQSAQTAKAGSTFGVSNVLPPELTGPSSAPTLEAPVTQDFESLVMLLQQAKSKLNDAMSKATSEEVRNNGEIKKEHNEKLLKKMEEQWDKIAESNKKSKIGKIFGIIGKIAAVVASVALAVITAGAAAPAVTGILIAVSAISVVDLASTISVTAGGPDFSLQAGASKLGQAIYPNDEEKAQKFGMIMGITLTVGVAVAGLGAAVVGASALAEVPAMFAKISIAAGVVGGTANATAGGVGIAAAADKRDADQLAADQIDIKKFLSKLQALMEEDSERLQEIVEQAQDSMQKVASMISSTAETKMQITRRMI
ncbi:type III secretion system translocon subunit SctE [Thalassospira lucentensis]|uniref:type III secretion system translocon subunit SctE n=1 Tax=Thalassospira lucentensis TaxID=168935 RepID=UPI00142DFBE1|nr:type III secretion system translocon subunit SctE [Thalassospira lucentensis]NIZ03775.1 type III secretion system translocon subunit SctE [Thalassospira lucentensis]